MSVRDRWLLGPPAEPPARRPVFPIRDLGGGTSAGIADRRVRVTTRAAALAARVSTVHRSPAAAGSHLNQVEFWGLPPKSHDEGPELLTGGFRATSSSAHIHKQQQQLTVLLLFSSLFEDFKTPALPSLSFQMGCEQSLILEMLRRQFFI